MPRTVSSLALCKNPAIFYSCLHDPFLFRSSALLAVPLHTRRFLPAAADDLSRCLPRMQNLSSTDDAAGSQASHSSSSAAAAAAATFRQGGSGSSSSSSSLAVPTMTSLSSTISVDSADMDTLSTQASGSSSSSSSSGRNGGSAVASSCCGMAIHGEGRGAGAVVTHQRPGQGGIQPAAAAAAAAVASPPFPRSNSRGGAGSGSAGARDGPGSAGDGAGGVGWEALLQQEVLVLPQSGTRVVPLLDQGLLVGLLVMGELPGWQWRGDEHILILRGQGSREGVVASGSARVSCVEEVGALVSAWSLGAVSYINADPLEVTYVIFNPCVSYPDAPMSR